MNHKEARDALEAGYQLQLFTTPTLTELQFAQAVSYHETKYGRAWSGVGSGSHNWGAVQCAGKPPCDLAQCFPWGDSNPNDDGTSTPYMGCFRKYPTDVEGAAGVLKELYTKRKLVREAAQTGSLIGGVQEMYDATYFTGFGKNERERVNNYFVPVYAALCKIAVVLGEPMLDGTHPPEKLELRDPFMTGEDVKRLQRIVRCRPDGVFGPITQKAVKAFQTRVGGLGADGIVGGYTWANIVLCEMGRK